MFVFWRGFFKDPKQLDEPVKVMEQTRIYPLGKKASAKPMQFPNASQTPANMLYPTDGSAFDMLARFISARIRRSGRHGDARHGCGARHHQRPSRSQPDAHTRDILDKGARTASRIGHATSYEPQTIVPNGLWYTNRRWLNVFPGNATFTADTFNFIDPRTGFFTNAYSASPGMAVTMVKVGAKYPATFVDADGAFPLRLAVVQAEACRREFRPPLLVGDRSTTRSPRPASTTASRSRRSTRWIKPSVNADGSTDIYFGPDSPGDGKNWLRTLPDKGFFVILRHLWTDAGVLRQEVEAERYREASVIHSHHPASLRRRRFSAPSRRRVARSDEVVAGTAKGWTAADKKQHWKVIYRSTSEAPWEGSIQWREG